MENDPPLGDGWGHWVPNKPYQEYIGEYGGQVEVCIYYIYLQQCAIALTRCFLIHPQPNLCESELHAVDHANTRFSQGYAATGVGGVVCARHGLVRKNGMGNLQKGERFDI